MTELERFLVRDAGREIIADGAIYTGGVSDGVPIEYGGPVVEDEFQYPEKLEDPNSEYIVQIGPNNQFDADDWFAEFNSQEEAMEGIRNHFRERYDEFPEMRIVVQGSGPNAGVISESIDNRDPKQDKDI